MALNTAISIIRKVRAFKEESFSTIVSPRNPYSIDASYDISKEYREPMILQCLGIENKKRVVKPIPTRFVRRGHEETPKYRLFISKADGAAGQIGFPVPARIIGKTEIASPNMVCTETFLRVGAFDTLEQTTNVQKYMQTKFFRLLVGARKNKNMTQSTYSFAPIQDWNIVWTDEMLYKKYNLTEEEIAFIEEMISPMDFSGGDE